MLRRCSQGSLGLLVCCRLRSIASATERRRRPGTSFIEHYECRGTSLIGAGNLSPDTKLVAGIGAVSRYNLSRSQKFVAVQEFNSGQMSALPTDFVGRSRLCRSKAEAEHRWVSGCNKHYKFVLSSGASR